MSGIGFLGLYIVLDILCIVELVNNIAGVAGVVFLYFEILVQGITHLLSCIYLFILLFYLLVLCTGYWQIEGIKYF